MSIPEQPLRLSLDGPIAHLVIERPEVRNALAGEHWRRLDALLSDAESAGARVLWLQGIGGAFSAGADIAELERQQGDSAALLSNAEQVQAVQKRLQASSLLSLALIDGSCMGGGLGLALCCDFRLATPGSRFALAPARLGLRYSLDDTRRLVNAIGLPRASDMLLSGRQVGSNEALAWGLINEQVDATALGERAGAISANLLAGSQAAAIGIKQTLACVGGDASIDQQVLWQGFRDAFSSADFAEGCKAFCARRPAKF